MFVVDEMCGFLNTTVDKPYQVYLFKFYDGETLYNI